MDTVSPQADGFVLDDGANAESERAENLHGVRYIEMFLAAKDPNTGNLVAACYNSMMGPAGIPASRDTAPQAAVAGLDFEKIKEDFGILGASLNGPKIFMPDWADLEVGVMRDFNGIKAPWVGQLNMTGGGGVSEMERYAPATIARTSGIGWNKGTTAMLLDDADGNTWIMKGFQLGLQPQHTLEQFIASGQSNFEKLPPGWKFRTEVLDEDLVETPESGVATIMPDEFFNVYDKTGPGMTNYTP